MKFKSWITNCLELFRCNDNKWIFVFFSGRYCFELPESDDIISSFNINGEHDEETDDDSNETPIMSVHEALKSLENVSNSIRGYQQLLKAVNSLEKFIRKKKDKFDETK